MSPLKKRFGREINPMREEDRMCLCKRRFDTKEACEASIVRGGSLIPLRAYKCKYCRGWHKTKHQEKL